MGIYTTRLGQLQSQLTSVIQPHGYSEAALSQYDEDAASLGTGAEWQYRAHLREQEIDSNEIDMVAEVTCVMHAVVTYEVAFLSGKLWPLQEELVDPITWEGLAAVKSVVDAPEVEDIEITGSVYSWSVTTAVVLQP